MFASSMYRPPGYYDDILLKTGEKSMRISVLNRLAKMRETEDNSSLKEMLKEKREFGEYVPGSGAGKSGYYKGFWCDSSNELAWVIYHLEHDIDFEKNEKEFLYFFDGKKRYYIPDFIKDKVYIEIKGNYVTPQTRSKIKQFPSDEKLHVVTEGSKEFQRIYDYVVDKYGEDFTKLYEGRAGFSDKLREKREKINEEREEEGLEPLDFSRPRKEDI